MTGSRLMVCYVVYRLENETSQTYVTEQTARSRTFALLPCNRCIGKLSNPATTNVQNLKIFNSGYSSNIISLDDWSRRTRHHNFIWLYSATGRSWFAVLLKCASHQVGEVDTNRGEHVGMLIHDIEALLPDRGAALYAAQLAAE